MNVTSKEMKAGLPGWNEVLTDTVDGLAPEWTWEVETPAFVYDEGVIHRLLDCATVCRERAGLKLLFAVKSFSFADALEVMAPRVDGFAVSSLFEARLARAVSGEKGMDSRFRGNDGLLVSVTTPGLRPQDAGEIALLCDSISFNSLNQWDMHYPRMRDTTSCGLRVNPQMPFADDLQV